MVYITYYINVNIQKRRFEDMFQVEFYEKEDGDIPVEKIFKQFRHKNEKQNTYDFKCITRERKSIKRTL